MKKSNLHFLAQEWFDKADEDLAVAEHLYGEQAFPSPICFHLHQAVEKYLKGFLVWHGKDIKDEFKIHNLEKLYEYAHDLDSRLGEEVKESCFTLNRYYVGTRYPADMPEYSWKEITEALNAARLVKEVVNRLLK